MSDSQAARNLTTVLFGCLIDTTAETAWSEKMSAGDEEFVNKMSVSSSVLLPVSPDKQSS